MKVVVNLAAVLVLVALTVLACDRTEQVTTTRAVSTYGVGGPAPLRQMVAVSKVVARVRFVSVKAVGVHSWLYTDQHGNHRGYVAALEYTFSVVEYLKGTGSPQIKAVVYGGADTDERFIHETQQGAQELAQALLPARDTRWDDRETLAFLRYYEPAGHYYLGYIDPSHPYLVNVTVASASFKALLPSVSTSTLATASYGGASAASAAVSDPKYFFGDPLDVEITYSTPPAGASASASETVKVSPVPTISLGDVKDLITEIQTWVAESGGTAKAEECINSALAWERTIKIYGHDEYRRYNRKMASGAPAGADAFIFDGTSELISDSEARGEPFPTDPKEWSEIWYTGRDATLFGYRIPGFATLVRPLPAGEYRLFLHHRWRIYAVCDFYPAALRNKREYVLTVTAPAGTLAESFFDPYASSTAIVGTTTVGTISWQSGEVTAALTRSVTGHALDFIDLKGTTTLSLPASNATTTASGALIWAVSKQPWKAGDKLMLRVRKADASTPTPTPTPTATPTPTPTATPTATATPTPTPTPTATPTPTPAPKPTATPTPTGKLTIGSTSIVKGGSTKVTAHGVNPANLLVRISTSHHLTLTGSCDGYGIFGAGGAAPFTSTLTGCNVGTATVKLVTIGSGAVLATLQVEVLPSNSGGKR